MAQPIESLHTSWHALSDAHNMAEPNPVISPYKHAEVKNLYEGNGITINKRLVTMKDGTQYWVTSSDIDRRLPEGLQGVAHYEGVAYTTWPEGLYVERQKRLAEIGFASSVFSVPDNIGRWISYEDNVNNYLSLTTNEALEHDRDPQVANYSGISQGSMNGTGYISLAPEHNINVIAAHLNVLCLPDGIKLEHMKYLPGHLAETLVKMPYEVFALVSLFKNLDEQEKEALLPTLDRRKKALIIQVQMLRSLLSGGAGEYARKMGEDLPIVAELNGRDALSREKRWINSYLGDRPNVLIKRSPRHTHGHSINPIAQTNWVGFETAVADVLTTNPEIRSHPETIGAKMLEIMREEHPHYTKPAETATLAVV